MKKYEPKAIHNVSLLSHGGVGKTTLAEAISYTAKATSKLGKVDNNTSVFDSRADEKARKMTISMAAGSVEWDGTKINFLDTPGFLDLLGDARLALSVTESAVILIDAASGIQVGTEQVMRLVEEEGAPRMFYLNGMDKENVDFNKLIDELKGAYGTSVAPIQIPMGTGAGFRGVVDLIEKVAHEYKADGTGTGKTIDIPPELSDQVEAMRGQLMETVAESDEDLMNKYFEEGELTDADLRKGLAAGVVQGLVFPVLCGSAAMNAGTDLLLRAIRNLSPSAEARQEITMLEGDEEKIVPCDPNGSTVAFVFKTHSEEHLGELNIVRLFSGKLTTGHDVYNSSKQVGERVGSMFSLLGHQRTDVTEISAGDIGGLLKMKDTHTCDTLVEKGTSARLPRVEFAEPLVSVAINAVSKGDEEKVGVGLAKLHEEDPTFTYQFHSDIKQSILSAMGDIHLDIILESLKSRFKVEVERHAPKVSYRETITKSAKYVEYTHKKQTGGAGQFARVFIDMEPRERGAGYEFEDKIVGGVIDQSLRPSVDKGIKQKLEEGILAGYPIVDVKVALVDGKTHPVDSKDVAFQIAGREVFKKAFMMSSPILLEPVSDITVTVPDDYTGDVMGDLSSRRGRISGMEPQGNMQTIKAKVPESEVQSYSQALRSLTQGRGFYSRTFSHYEQVPAELTKKIVEASKAGEEPEV